MTHFRSLAAALDAVLHNYADLLTIFAGERVRPGAVTVLVSGNRPYDLLRAAPLRFVASDGLLKHLDDASFSPVFMPLISDP